MAHVDMLGLIVRRYHCTATFVGSSARFHDDPAMVGRNQRPQAGLRLGPDSSRVTGRLRPSEDRVALKDYSSRRPVGVAGNTTDSGVRDRLIWPAKSSPAA